MAHNPVMNRNPYFREPTTPNFGGNSAYGQQAQYGQQIQYDQYGQPVYNQQANSQFFDQASAAQAYTQQQFGAGDSRGAFQTSAAGPNTMTYDDAMIKTLFLIGVTTIAAVLSAFFIPAKAVNAVAISTSLLALGLSFFAAFRPMVNPGVAIGYAALEGVALGAITGVLNHYYPGIALQAILGTLVVVAVAAGLFLSGAVRTTPKGRKFVMVVLVAAIIYSLVNLVLANTVLSDRFFGMDTALNLGGVPLGLILGVILIVVAAYFLIGDLEDVRYAVENGAPKKFAWTVGFSITVTVIWIYIEVLRVLAILANDN